MIPSGKFLFYATVIVVPAGAAIGTVGSWTPLAILVILAFLVLVLIDLCISSTSLHDVTITIPEVIRMTKDRETPIPLMINRPLATISRLKIVLELPTVFDSGIDTLDCQLPADGNTFKTEWRTVPAERGKYALEGYAMECTSRIGLWDIRKRVSQSVEIRVYPNLLSERNNLSAIFLNRGREGMHARRMIGQGREFEKLREYMPGDSTDQIHWKATAKRNAPISKIYQVERTQELYVLLDTSRLSARTPSPDTTQPNPVSQLEQFIKTALLMGLVAEQQGDMFGMLSFDSQVRTFLRAKGGKSHFSACRDKLYMLQSNSVTPDFRELFTHIRQYIKKRALLVILTNLDDPVLSEEFLNAVQIIQRQHLITVMNISPTDTCPIFCGEPVTTTNDIYRHLAGHLQHTDLKKIQGLLSAQNIPFLTPNHESLSLQAVSQYLSIKGKQIL